MKTSILEILIAVLTVVVVVLLIEGFVLLAALIVCAAAATLIVSVERDKFTLTVKKSTFDRLALLSYCLLCFVYFASIPKIAFLPVSPKYFLFIFTIGLLILSKRTVRFPNLYSLAGPIVLFLIMTMLYSFVQQNVREMIAPLEGIVLMAVTMMIVGSNKQRCILLTRLFAMFTVFSAVWFFCCLLFYDSFMAIRKIVYAGYYEPDDAFSIAAMVRPTGLTFNHHIMGYQMTAGVVLVGCLVLLDKSSSWRRLWMLLFPVMVLALICTAQRSTLPAVVLSFVGYTLFVLSRKRRLIMKKLVFGVIFCIVVIYSVNMMSFGSQYLKTLSIRFTHENDIRSRLGWQAAAVKIILETPLGMRVEGKSWETESLRKGADYSAFGGTVMDVHNGYLLIMLTYGWMGVSFVIASLWFLTRRMLWIIRSITIRSVSEEYAIAVTFTLIALLLQALFHHASIFKNDNISCLVLSLFLVWVNVLRKDRTTCHREGLTDSF